MIDKKTKIKATLDARDVPAEMFGSRKGRRTRKFVFVTISTWANPDGTGAYPSQKTIGTACDLSDRGLRKAILWLEENGFLEVDYKAGPHGTNNYTLHFADEDRAAARARFVVKYPAPINPERNGSQYAGTQTRNASVPGPPGTLEHDSRNDSVADPEQMRTDPEQISSPNRPINRPYKPSVEREGPEDRVSTCLSHSGKDAVSADGQTKSKDETKRLTKAVISTMNDIAENAVMYREDQAELGKQIQESDWTEQEVRMVTQRIIGPLDDYARKRAGNTLTVRLSAGIDNIRKEKAEQARQARLLELARKQAAESDRFHVVEEEFDPLPTAEELGLTGEER